jgi:cytochrome P450 family 142 subfamily A polypeptide 1
MTSKTGSATTASPTTPPADAQPSTAQPTGLDLLDPELYRGNPQELWAELLAGDTLARDRNGLWAVTQHAHLREAERRSADFTSGPGYRSLPSADENNLIALDDPEHLRQRRLVSGRFTPRAVRTHETWLRAAIGELLDAATDADTATGRGEMEVIDELASQLPCRLTARLLGFPEESWRDIKEWSEALMRIDEVERDQHAALGLFNAVVAFNGVLQPLAEQRRAEPADDLVSVWANADVDEFTYDPTRLYHEVGLFIAGGAETTRTAIAHGLRAFCDHPEQWEYRPRAIRPQSKGDPVAPQQLLPNRRLRHHAGGHRPRHRRPPDPLVPGGQPRPEGLQRSHPLRHHPLAQPAPGLRARHPLLRRGEPGPLRADDPLRGAHAPDP